MVLINLCFTYRKNVKKAERPNVTYEHYNVCFDTLKKQGGDIIDFYYEKDNKGRFHLHGLMLISKKIRYTDLKVQGFASKMVRAYNTANWLSYCQKSQTYALKLQRELSLTVLSQDNQSDFSEKSLAISSSEDGLTTLRDPYVELLTPKEEQIKIPKKKLF